MEPIWENKFSDPTCGLCKMQNQCITIPQNPMHLGICYVHSFTKQSWTAGVLTVLILTATSSNQEVLPEVVPELAAQSFVLDMGFGLGYMGYRFGIGLNGIQVWDWVIWDIGLGLGFMGYRFLVGFYGI